MGHDGVVLHSNNAGQSWSLQLDGRRVGPIMLGYYEHQLSRHPDDADLQMRVSDAQRMVEEGADKPFLDVWFETSRSATSSAHST
ncbi:MULTISPECIES: hypothetical protein [unclassified Pseudomonas]|uniref:hypothetical protein n=1 Tax=unclassified Pseudomonas TaxID=196821 RepID=UPI002114CABB|nr:MULTISPECIES: hypothetical protein [unclassified Pseudomonas]